MVDGIWWIWDFDKRRYVSTGQIGTVEAQTLGSLTNVDDAADDLGPDDMILIKRAGKSGWTLLKPDFASAAVVESLKTLISDLEKEIPDVPQGLKYDEYKQAWYVEGDFYATGEVSAFGKGDGIDTPSGEGIVDEQMSDTSDNAISNRVVKAYIDKTDAELLERVEALEQGAGASGEGDKNYYHSQGTPQEEWVIEHNLGKYPAVTVINSAGEQIYCDVKFDSINQVTLKFGSPLSGSAFMN